jgi:hypothetical protein
MSFGLFDIAEIWKAQRDSSHSSSSPSSSVLGLVLLHSKCCRGDCLFHVTVKVLLLRRIFFLSCGLPSKCVVVVENEFLSLLWVTYLPMICFQRFQLSAI